MLDSNAIRAQSLNAYGQWKDIWRANAKAHSKFQMKPLTDFVNIGVGKAVLCVATGHSFELEIETIKKYQDKVDIFVCDKSLGACLDNGIRPTYVMVCDAKVSYEKYLKPWENQLEGITLFANACGNTQWTHNGNWKDIYFFVNMDILGSEKEFSELSGCKNFIPAGTNVSNAMVVFMTQSDNHGRKNFFGYDKILLVGFDYSWTENGNYYAFNKDGNGKHNYMRHMFIRNIDNDFCYTSNNLAFSAAWLEQYVKGFNLPVVQCSGKSVLNIKNKGNLAEQMQYAFKTEDSEKVRKLTLVRSEYMSAVAKIEHELKEIGRQHYFAFAGSV